MATIRAGLIGAEIQGSRSPAMHMHEGRETGLSYSYELIDTAKRGLGPEDLPDLLDDAERRGFSGLNITHPFKQRVLPLLTALSDDARAIGAVNTVVFSKGQRIGHNTDWWGFLEAFKLGLPNADYTSVVQLGAGGAGAATAFGMLRLGTRRLTIFDTNESRATALASDMQKLFPDSMVEPGLDLSATLALAQGIVHATPTGMVEHPGLPLPAAFLDPRLWIAEVVYFPLKTALLQEASSRGCRTLNGGGMAVFQAAEAFRLFTGRKPDANRMLSHFRSMTEEDQVRD
ncbi:shikimate dehydrogenase [Acidisoma cellulosilytica]|uniref:Shikimate dehydrogenase n=2 Tax=Acidisoma cellulosilyticum TaxID=2802395 RepID=A0A963Z3U6_9PROT|nr:shikimate dehydrogenase [Acidisoma cellulosilyticum]